MYFLIVFLLYPVCLAISLINIPLEYIFLAWRINSFFEFILTSLSSSFLSLKYSMYSYSLKVRIFLNVCILILLFSQAINIFSPFNITVFVDINLSFIVFLNTLIEFFRVLLLEVKFSLFLLYKLLIILLKGETYHLFE